MFIFHILLFQVPLSFKGQKRFLKPWFYGWHTQSFFKYIYILLFACQIDSYLFCSLLGEIFYILGFL